MNNWLPIKYRECWDVPRIFFVEHNKQLFLFDCQFDEALDDYPESYQVFLMPSLSEQEFAGSWAKLWLRAIQKVADIPILTVRFDPTRRAAIDADVFEAIRPTSPQLNGTNANVETQEPVS